MGTNFWKLFTSQSTTNVGDVLYIIAIITVLYNQYNSAFLLSLLPFVITISKFACGLVSPLILDKYELKRLLLNSQLAKVLLFILLCFILFQPEVTLWLVIGLVALISIADGIQQPVSYALIPSIVEEKNLVKANSMLSISFHTSDLITWSIGAVIVSVLSYKYSMIITLSLYIVSVISIFFITKNAFERDECEENQHLEIRQSLYEGWNLIFNNPILKRFLLMDALKGIAYTVWVAAILYVFVEQNLKVGEEWWGYLNTSRILGTILAGYLVLKISKKIDRNLISLLFITSLSIATLTLIFGLNSIPYLALILVFLLGFPEQVDDIVQNTFTQKYVKEVQLAKVYTTQSIVYYLVFALSVLLAGFLVDHFNIRVVFILASFALFINVAVAWNIKQNNILITKELNYDSKH